MERTWLNVRRGDNPKIKMQRLSFLYAIYFLDQSTFPLNTTKIHPMALAWELLVFSAKSEHTNGRTFIVSTSTLSRANRQLQTNAGDVYNNVKIQIILTHLCIVESFASTLWTGPFPIKGYLVSCLLLLLLLLPCYIEIPVCNADSAFCCVWSWSTLFAHVPFMGRHT